MSLLDHAAAIDTPIATPIVDTPVEVTPPIQEGTLPVDEGTNATPTDTPETPERPEWLPEGIDTPEDLAAKYEALLNPESKAPESYELTASEEFSAYIEDMGLTLIGNDDPLIKGVTETAKELNLSNDDFNKLAESYIKANHEQEKLRASSEFEALGADGNKIVNRISQWANLNLNEEQQGWIAGAATTAGGIKFIEHMLNTIQAEGDMGKPTSAKGETLSLKEIQAMQASPEYQTNPAFRDKVKAAYAALY